jgi:serine/threonine protein kinase
MENRSLLNLLQTTGPQYNVRQKFLMAIQIANRMKFLESIRIIHRDLAARNIFISFQNGSLVLKIADFGLSKQDDYKLRANFKISLEWTAPEVINHRKYTHKSNVWSFGVTFWEILRDSQHPPLKFHEHQFTTDNVETFRKEMISFWDLTKKTFLFVEFFENI